MNTFIQEPGKCALKYVCTYLQYLRTGNILAASAGDNKVTLWHESPDGEWAQLSSMDENGAVTAN